MTDSNEKLDFQQQLDAFADGELEPDEKRKFLDRMAADPLLAHGVINQQELRQAVSRVVHQQTPATPASLKSQLTQMAEQTPSAQGGNTTATQSEPLKTRRAGPFGIRIWTPVAIAALFFVSATVFLTIAYQDRGIIAEQRYAQFVDRHLDCSGKTSLLQHQELFKQNIHLLPESITAFLGKPFQTRLDLSSIGYEFVAVGECNVPGPGSVHLIYRAVDDPTGRDTISLWIRVHDGTTDVTPNKPYVHTGDQLANPLLLWQQREMVYYLVGESLAKVENAARSLRTTG